MTRLLRRLVLLLALVLTSAGAARAEYYVQKLHNVSGVVPRLVDGMDGFIYGLTGGGAFFRVTYDGSSFAVLSSLPDGPTWLTRGSDGNFYGVQPGGGAYGYGAIFRLTPAGSRTVVVDCGMLSRGGLSCALPLSILGGADGNLYGLSLLGGENSNWGGVFRLTVDGAYQQLFTFLGGAPDLPV